MNKEHFILPSTKRPSWVEYPPSFCRIVDQELIHITPWHIMEGERALEQFQGLRKRYPARELFPFAYRQDNDDVACLAKGLGERVFVIHDFASQGDEDVEAFEDVWSWFRSAVEETITWD